MANIPEQLEIIIEADGDEAKATLKDLENEIESLKNTTDGNSTSTKQLTAAQNTNTSSMRSLSSSIAGTLSKYVSLGLAIREVAAFMTRANAAAEEENIGLIRLQSVIELTGRAAETSAFQIDSMADKLELISNADKQAIMNTAASLAIMGNVPTSLFEQIFETANDLSQVVGSDIGSAIITIGRALEDPIEGLTRLRRQGIFISDELQAQISSLVSQNNLYEAQALLLNDIQGKVEGTADKIAEAAGNSSLSTAIDRYYGSVGQILNNAASPITGFLAGMINMLAAPLDTLTDISRLASIFDADLAGMSLGELQDFFDLYNSLMEDPFSIFSYGTIAAFEKEILPLLEEQIAIKTEEYNLDRKRAKEAEEQKKAEAERLAQIEEQAKATESLQKLYAGTGPGMVKQATEELEQLQSQYEADQQALINTTDNAIKAQIEQRLPLYEALISAKQEELKNLTDLNAESAGATESIVKKILGMSADDYVLNIPISFDFGRSELETVEEQLSAIKSAINQLWRSTPAEGGLDEWNAALETLNAKYEELEGKALSIKESQEEASNLERLKAEAQSELNKLLSEEEQAQNSLEAYAQKLNNLLEKKLISQEEYNELLLLEKQSLGLIAEETDACGKAINRISADFENFVKMSLSAESIGGQLSSVFESMGTAIGSDGNAIEALSDGLGNWVQDLTAQLSTLFVSAGLRLIIEGGLAGLAPGIALMAMGGVTGIASGMMGSSSAAMSDDIMQSMQDEMEARQKLSHSINESIDTEYELLKRQLERNLISEEDFISRAGDLQNERNTADARVQIAQSIYSGIQNLNSEYQSMSGWDKFWSGRDEDIKDEIETLQRLYDSVDSATVDELRSLVEQLKALGLSTGSIPKFANGGEFITDGPQLIMVGDNPSGREHVSITPLEAQESPTPSSNTTVIQIQGDVYGWDDLYAKLQQVGMKVERRKRA